MKKTLHPLHTHTYVIQTKHTLTHTSWQTKLFTLSLSMIQFGDRSYRQSRRTTS
ncbi:hypothetical protein HanPI659440_Chr12g0447361 [Helianthus annuus]|nr:hypothetical protein HanPI659440_Chr12g0447361 [Helianthus annuus]